MTTTLPERLRAEADARIVISPLDGYDTIEQKHDATTRTLLRVSSTTSCASSPRWPVMLNCRPRLTRF